MSFHDLFYGREKMKQVISFLIIIIISFIHAHSQSITAQVAPLNPDFFKKLYSGGYYIPSPFLIEHKTKKRSEIPLPRHFDLRDFDYITSVKNQGNIGACWAFATFGTLESDLLKQGEKFNYDFSENNLIMKCGYTIDITQEEVFLQA